MEIKQIWKKGDCFCCSFKKVENINGDCYKTYTYYPGRTTTYPPFPTTMYLSLDALLRAPLIRKHLLSNSSALLRSHLLQFPNSSAKQLNDIVVNHITDYM